MLNVIENLVEQITQIQDRYIDAFDSEHDFKMLQGAERCVELKMKLFGIDGKQPLDATTPSAEIAIDLTKISSSALSEILLASNKN